MIEIVPGAVHARIIRLSWRQQIRHAPGEGGGRPSRRSPDRRATNSRHGLDYALGYLSHSAGWLRIWQAEKAAGKVPSFAGQREKPQNILQNSLAICGTPTLFITSKAAQDFIMQLVWRFIGTGPRVELRNTGDSPRPVF